MVVHQLPGFAGLATGGAVGVEVAAAEAVDRLLGIAHQHQGMEALAEGPPQDAPLDRVGVLKLIHQGGAVTPGHRLQQRARHAVVQSRIEPLKQLGEGGHSPPLPPAHQLGAAPVAGVEQHQLGRTLQQRRHGPQQGFLGQALWLFPLQPAGDAAEGARVEVAAEQILVPHCFVVPLLGLLVDPAVEHGDPVLAGAVRVGLCIRSGGPLDSRSFPVRGCGAEFCLQGFPPLPPLGQKPLPALANDCR